MPAVPSTRLVEITFVSSPPASEITRAAGVQGVEIEGSTVRCLVEGSFQPFLEAIRAHEVLDLTSVPLRRAHHSPRSPRPVGDTNANEVSCARGTLT